METRINKKFILWDNDGVLVDTEKYYLKANTEVLRELGIELTLDAYKRISLEQGKSVLELARSAGLNDRQLTELRDKRDDIYEQYIFNRNLALKGAAETLETLHGLYGMGVVTSTKTNYFERLHSLTGFRKYFKFVIAREDYNKPKPDPEAYLLGIQKSGYTPREIIAVEDTPRGLTAATKAGIDCIVIPNEFTRDVEFSGQILRLNSIMEITSCLIKNFD